MLWLAALMQTNSRELSLMSFYIVNLRLAAVLGSVWGEKGKVMY